MLWMHHTASAILKIYMHIAGIKPTTVLLLCDHTHIAPSPILNIR